MDKINHLILGDNLKIMQQMSPENIDVAYLDPPFFKQYQYEAIWNDEGERRSFQEHWKGGTEQYIAWLKDRVAAVYRLLKPTGSLFLHCSLEISAAIRCQILDNIFGLSNLRGEIIWHPEKLDSSRAQQKGLPFHSVILYYSKSNTFTSHISSKHGTTTSVWTDIENVSVQDKHHIGYPTQKPITLLERIIALSSNEGQIVFDPFVGGGTTIIAAERMKRRWIGIDESVTALKLSEMRVQREPTTTSLPNVQIDVYDNETIRRSDPFIFERLIVEALQGRANEQQRNDKGIDGRKKDGTLIQVKRSENIDEKVVAIFRTALEREAKKERLQHVPHGILAAFSFTKSAKEEVKRLQKEYGISIELRLIKTIINVADRPSLELMVEEITQSGKSREDARTIKGGLFEDLKEITFIAKSIPTDEVLFYAWDFAYNGKTFCPEVFIDRRGQQQRKMKAGEYMIAVKVVHKNGLDSMIVRKLLVSDSIKIIAL